MRPGRPPLPHCPPRPAVLLARAGLVVALLALLPACASTIGDLPAAVGGLPEGTPERSATPTAYPAVHDMPPQRSTAVMTDAEQKKTAAELTAARAAQDKRAAAAAQDR